MMNRTTTPNGGGIQPGEKFEEYVPDHDDPMALMAQAMTTMALGDGPEPNPLQNLTIPNLTRKQMLALELIRDPQHLRKTHTQLAQMLGISRRTLYNWFKNPTFNRYLRPANEALVEGHYNQFIYALVRELEQNSSIQVLKLFYKVLTDSRKAMAKRREAPDGIPWEQLPWLEAAYQETLEGEEILQGNHMTRANMERYTFGKPLLLDETDLPSSETLSPYTTTPPPEWEPHLLPSHPPSLLFPR